MATTVQRDADILGEVALSVRWIKRKTAARPPGERRTALRDEAKRIEAAIKSLKGLPDTTQRQLIWKRFNASMIGRLRSPTKSK